MQYFKNFLLLVLIFLFVFFLSINSQLVEITLLPAVLNFKYGVIQLPLFTIMLTFTGLGLLSGVVIEYLRAYKYRKGIKRDLIQAEKINSEINYLRHGGTTETDKILSLLK